MSKIPQAAEACSIFEGEVYFLNTTVSGFIRLKHASCLGDLTDVPLPTRFIFFLLGPNTSTKNHVCMFQTQ
jgi:hypothetical protein